MNTTAKDRQTLADIGLICGGTFAEGLETAIRNGLSASAELADGQDLETAEATGGAENRTIRRYAVERVDPATEASDEDRAACPYGGIGYMGIEIDFIVS